MRAHLLLFGSLLPSVSSATPYGGEVVVKSKADACCDRPSSQLLCERECPFVLPAQQLRISNVLQIEV
jgi:hypothetical protein